MYNLVIIITDKHRSRQDDIMFDDDDVLGGMGLSSPTASKK